MEENNVIKNFKNNEYKIKNHIIYPDDDSIVTLFTGDMDELPEYIQFGDGEYTLRLGGTGGYHAVTKKNIKSFSGLPKEVKKLHIEFPRNISYPGLDIKVFEVYISESINNRGELNITKTKDVDDYNDYYDYIDFVNFKNRININYINIKCLHMADDKNNKNYREILNILKQERAKRHDDMWFAKPISIGAVNEIIELINNCNINVKLLSGSDETNKIIIYDYNLKKSIKFEIYNDQWYWVYT